MNEEGIRGLLERVERATGPDAQLDEALTAFGEGAERVEDATFDHKHGYARDGFWVSIGPIKPFTASIDAAFALVERLLPGSNYGVDKTDEGDELTWFDATAGEGFAQHNTAPLAILCALLKALPTSKQGA